MGKAEIVEHQSARFILKEVKKKKPRPLRSVRHVKKRNGTPRRLKTTTGHADEREGALNTPSATVFGPGS